MTPCPRIEAIPSAGPFVVNGSARMILPDSGRVVTDLSALVAGGWTFPCLYADPPWRYDQKPRGAAEHHYPTMSLDELAAMPVEKLAKPDCHLHLWTTHSFFESAIRLMESWGFRYRSLFVWAKPQLGMGFYWRSSVELLLLGVRGQLPFQDKSIPNWSVVPRGKHSAKPDCFRKLVECVSPGPRLELFGRKSVPGWVVFGNQVDEPMALSQSTDLFTTTE